MKSNDNNNSEIGGTSMTKIEIERKKLIDLIDDCIYNEKYTELDSLEKQIKEMDDKELLSIYSEAYLDWGNSLEDISDTKEGVELEELYNQVFEIYQKAIEIKPDKHEAWYNMGNSYQNKGDLINARQCYKKAYELDPNDKDYKKAIENIGEE